MTSVTIQAEGVEHVLKTLKALPGVLTDIAVGMQVTYTEILFDLLTQQSPKYSGLLRRSWLINHDGSASKVGLPAPTGEKNTIELDLSQQRSGAERYLSDGMRGTHRIPKPIYIVNAQDYAPIVRIGFFPALIAKAVNRFPKSYARQELARRMRQAAGK